MEMNNYLPLLHGSSPSKKMDPEEVNDIIIHTVPNVWGEQAYLHEWKLEGMSYEETCEIIEHI